MKHKLLSLFFATIVAMNVFAQFSGSGSGTETDPYLIFNPIQLDQVRNFSNQTGVYFKMMADIDLEEFIEDNYPIGGWSPIGNFKGVFDGNGKQISNLSINRPSTNTIGLFSGIGGARIQNLSIVNASVIGHDNVGSLVGAGTGTILNVSVDGIVTGDSAVGGICGNYAGTMQEISYNGEVRGGSNTGGLIGELGGETTISNVSVNADIHANGDCCGGIVAYYYKKLTIANALFKGDIEGHSFVGGIAGMGEIIKLSYSYAMVSIQTTGDYCGGAVGQVVKGESMIATTHISGDIVANNNVGGVAGYAHCFVHNCFFYGNVIGKQNVGGIYGVEGYPMYCYSYALIKGENYVGGIGGGTGRIDNSVAINSSVKGYENVTRIGITAYINKALNKTKVSTDGIVLVCEDSNQHGQGVGNTVLKYAASYQGIDWDFSSIWTIQETESYPYFNWQTAPPVINVVTAGETTISGQGVNGSTITVTTNNQTYQTTCTGNVWSVSTDPLVAGSMIYAIASISDKYPSYRVAQKVKYSGNGTASDPYKVYTPIELANISGEGYYKIMNDIDISSINPWLPIGQYEVVTANIDGDNHTISGLYIDSSEPYQGLFSQCYNNVIKNITLSNINVKGGNYTGGLVGTVIDGQIANCHISGNIIGGNYTAGLVGYTRNTNIEGCSVTAAVTGMTPIGGLIGEAQDGEITKSKYVGAVSSTTSNAVVGGLVGNSLANISECYSEGSATCSVSGAIVGGLVGVSNDAKVVTNCYSVAETSGGQYAGGLVGYNYGSVSNCYAQGSVTSIQYAAGVVGYNDGVNATTSHCFAMNREINATSSSGVGLRVIGGIKNSAPVPEMNNYALKSMPVSINGVAQKIYDDNLHGVAKTEEVLMQNATYQSEAWNMTSIWGIEETVTYPYLRYFTKFATITFLNYDGTILQSRAVKYGIEPAYTGATPTKPSTVQYSYVFSGWTPAIVPVTGDATYTAEFETVVNTYTITWQNEDGSLIDQTTVEYGVVPTHADPTKPATAEFTYTFAGWTPAVVAVTGDATYRATFNATKNSYTITWQNEDGSLIDQTTVEYGVVPTHADPTKPATAEFTYTFAGWTPAVVAVTGDATYRATFNATKNSYTITWQNEDGSLIDQTTVEYGVVPTQADPTKPATAEYTYTFAGWTPAVVAVTGNATYRATFNATKNSYTITWQNEDGSLIDQTTVEYGVVPTHADPVKQNTAEYTYTFAGWTPAVIAVTGNAIYRATFNATKNSYTITWQNEDGSLIDQTTVEYGVVPTHADPVKQNTAEYTYTFAGWTPAVVAVTGHATYRATFNATKNSYTITWQNEDGSLIDKTTVEYGVVPTHADPTKPATAEYTYIFSGWTPAVVAVTGDATYKATFTATKNSYTITWQNEDGSLIDQTTVEYGVVPTHVDPVKQNTAEYTYTFSGWTPAVVAVTGDATYKATFNATKNSYTITWQDENGALIDQTTVEYGVVPTHAEPTKEATAEYTYTFAGWTPAVEAVTGNATYRATFTASKNSYTITWQDEDGSLIDQTTVEYGVVPTHAEPTKEATAEYTYTFAGWTPAVVAVTGDATYKATFSSVVNVYTISVSAVNGQVIGGGEYQYGTTTDLTAIPNEGYVFDQWSDGVTDNPRTITVTDDAEYTALFTSTEGVDNIYTSEPVQKVIIDQKVYILRGDKTYTLTGLEVK